MLYCRHGFQERPSLRQRVLERHLLGAGGPVNRRIIGSFGSMGFRGCAGLHEIVRSGRWNEQPAGPWIGKE